MDHVGDTWDESPEQEESDTILPETERYVRRRIIGQGGMGRVVDVEDTRLGRRIALKEVLTADDPNVAARLAREAAITARLEHPGIVPVYDAGRTGGGRLFYTMRLIEGRALSERIRRAPTLKDRLPLTRAFLSVCQTIAYAHAQGVLHRDIKPDNVMLGPRGAALVVDWGLALRTDEPSPASIVGTPAYMSPEQAAGQPVDARSDVFSLGCTLHTVLFGEPPVRTADGMLRLSPKRRHAPPELVAILQRATALRPEQRYASADALADDIARYLDGQLVSAHRYTPGEQLARLAWQWRAPLLIAAIAAVLLAVVGARAWISTNEARQLSDANLQRALIAQAQVALDSDDRARAEILAANALIFGESPHARGVLSAYALRPRPILAGTSAALSCQVSVLSPDGRLIGCIEDGAVSLWETAPLRQRWRVAAPAGSLAFTGNRILVRNNDASGQVLSAATGATLLSYPGISRHLARGEGYRQLVHFNLHKISRIDPVSGEREVLERPCSTDVLTLTTDAQERLFVACKDSVVWQAPGEEPAAVGGITLLEQPAPHSQVVQLRVSPDGTRLALGSLKGQVELVDLTTHRSLGTAQVSDGQIRRLAFSDDGQTLAVLTEDRRVSLWHPATGAVSRLPAEDARDVAFADSELRILSDRLTRWRLPALDVPTVFRAGAGLSSVALSPDGTEVAAALGSGELVRWSQTDGTLRTRAVLCDENVLKDLDFAPDGTLVVAGAALPGLRSFAPDGTPGLALGTTGFRRVGAMADGIVWGLSWTGARLWQDGVALPVMPQTVFFEGEAAHGGRFAVLVDEEGDIYRLTARPTPAPRRIAHAVFPSAVAITADGTRIVWAEKQRLRIVNADGAPVGEIPRSQPALDLTLSPDGRWLAAADHEAVTLYDTSSTEAVAILRGHRDRIVSVEFSDDGDTLATGSWDGTARLWSVSALTADPADTLATLQAAWGLDLATALR